MWNAEVKRQFVSQIQTLIKDVATQKARTFSEIIVGAYRVAK